MAPAISEPDTPAAETQPTLLRTPAEAISIAEMAVANEAGEGRSERTIRGTSSVKPIVSHTSRGESDTLMYAVDFDEGQGFAIVSASRSVEPLLALIDDGSFDSPETQANESFQFALNCAKLYSMGPTKPTIPDPDGPVDFILSWYADTVFPTPKTTPSINVRWNQYWPEGMYSSNSNRLTSFFVPTNRTKGQFGCFNIDSILLIPMLLYSAASRIVNVILQ